MNVTCTVDVFLQMIIANKMNKAFENKYVYAAVNTALCATVI